MLVWIFAGLFGLLLSGFGWKGFAIWLIAPSVIGLIAQVIFGIMNSRAIRSR